MKSEGQETDSLKEKKLLRLTNIRKESMQKYEKALISDPFTNSLIAIPAAFAFTFVFSAEGFAWWFFIISSVLGISVLKSSFEKSKNESIFNHSERIKSLQKEIDELTDSE